ncbi:MAG: class I SAM-dependent methyltransferase [Actinomycetales bacterium]|nr:class I SAM-dependent methyltransferase [Actinomycetales bacterium]
MSHNELNWMFANEFVHESEVGAKARALSLEHGIEPVALAIGAQFALIAAATSATNIVEIGTGLGVSGLWLLAGAPLATLTSIDEEFEYHELARTLFTEAGYPASRVRLITGRALDVLPRMNENSYDLVVIDGDPKQLLENVEHALRLVRVGGTVLLPHALWRGEVADPVKRNAVASAFRAVLNEINSSDAVVAALSPAGDGLLQVTKLA